MSNNRGSILRQLRGKVNSKYGERTLDIAGRLQPAPGPRVTTGSLLFDYILGGGVPVGHILIFHGGESSGKTTHAVRIAGYFQKVCANCYRPVRGGLELYQVEDEETGEVEWAQRGHCDCVAKGLYTPCQYEKETIPEFNARCKRYAENSYEETRVAYLDNEGTFDVEWARRLGCNPDLLLLANPQTAEETVDMHDELVRTGSVDFIVLDSIAAMTPMLEITEKASDWQQGLAARIVNKFARKTVSSRHAVRSDFDRKTTEIWINQERVKIGVCFDARTLVTLGDGSQEEIGKIVNGKLPVDVLTKSSDGSLVPRRVVQWHRRPYTGNGLYVTIAGNYGKPRGVRVTPNHPFFTPTGQITAGELRPGTTVLSSERMLFSGDQHQVILGSILGDGSLRFERGFRGHLRVLHSMKQYEYCSWKASILGKEAHAGDRVCWFETDRSVEFTRYDGAQKRKRSNEQRTIPDSLIDEIGPLALAVWFMDDGSFEGKGRTGKWGQGRYVISARTLQHHVLEKLAHRIASIGAGRPTVTKTGLIWTGGDESADFARVIAPYVHPSMRYKIRHDVVIGGGEIKIAVPWLALYPVKIADVRPVSGIGRARDQWATGMQFDIGVEENHNYIAGGMLVHNSYGDPTVLPSGNGQRFAASIIVKMWASKWEKETLDEDMKKAWQTEIGTDVLMSMKVTKNKTARSQGQGGFRMGSTWKEAGQVLDIDYMVAQAEKFEILRKEDKKWLLGDESYRTKAEAIDRIREPLVRDTLRATLVKRMIEQS